MAQSRVDLQAKVRVCFANTANTPHHISLSYLAYQNQTLTLFFSISSKVCKDMSCSDGFSCSRATIGYVVGPSCTGYDSCFKAKIGSAILSCKDEYSCNSAQLNGIDLVNSCNTNYSCYNTNGNDEDFELIDCCNDEPIDNVDVGQCENKVGAGAIYNAGCVSFSCMCVIVCLYLSKMTHHISLVACTNLQRVSVSL